MRIRSFLYFIILVCHTTEICGQIVDNFQSSRLIPAPNAVGIDMFGEIPVSYYTGRANISVPLYSTVQRGVPFDMYLSYESSGVLVNSLHGWTGQSWTLFAGGNITRVVNGDYDENEYPFHSNSLYQKYFYRRSVWQELENAATPEAIQSFAQTRFVNSYMPDYCPDEFVFNFMGKSGKFYFGHDGKWKVKCNENIKVELDVTNPKNFISPFYKFFPCNVYGNGVVRYQPNTIKGFTLVDSSGNRYIFGGEEEGDTDAIEYVTEMVCNEYENERSWHAVTWNLKRVEDRFGNALYSFLYDRGKFMAQIFNSYEGVSNHLQGSSEGFGHVNTPEEFAVFSNHRFPYSLVLNSPSYLYRISVCDGTEIRFRAYYEDNYVQDAYNSLSSQLANTNSDLIEKLYSSDNANIRYPFFYLQYLSPESQEESKRLTSYRSVNNSDLMRNPLLGTSAKFLQFISINKPRGENSVIQTNYSLKYSSGKRRFLNHINYGSIGDTLYSYHFNYIHPDSLPDDYLTKFSDHWGYYNGVSYDDPQMEITPSTPGDSVTEQHFQETRPGDSYVDVADLPNMYNDNYYNQRMPDTIRNKYGLLNEIIYPTGGRSEITYEANRYSRVVSDSRNSMVNNSGIGAGSRISSIKEYNSPTSSTPVRIRTFTYDNLDGSSSGELYSLPKYSWRNWLGYSGLSTTNPIIVNLMRVGSIVPLYNSFGNSLGYSRVTETLGDGTKTVYNYSNFSNSLDNSCVYSFMRTCPSPYDRFNSKDYMNGNLLKQQTFNPEGQCIFKRVWSYRSSDDYQRNYIYSTNYGAGHPSVNASHGYETGMIYKIYYGVYDVKSVTDSTLCIMPDNSYKWLVDRKDFEMVDTAINDRVNSEIRLKKREFVIRCNDTLAVNYDYLLSDTSLVNGYVLPVVSEKSYHKNRIIKGNSVVYDIFNGYSVPKYEFQYVGSETPDTLRHYTSYTESMLPSEYVNEFGQKVRIIWNNNYKPLAEVVNANGVLTTNPNSTSPENAVVSSIQGEIYGDLPTDVVSCTYNARGLITSVTQKNRQTLYYEYDNYDRLVTIKDSAGNILKFYSYHYNNSGSASRLE